MNKKNITGWKEKIFNSKENWKNVLKLIKKVDIKYFGIDTETTGVHLIFDRLFALQFGFITTNNLKVVFYVKKEYIDNKMFENVLYEVCEKRNIPMIAWNVKFDIHMLMNQGINGWKGYNIYEGMLIPVLEKEIDNYSEKNSLKAQANKYFNESDELEKEVKKEMMALNRRYNKGLLKDKPNYSHITPSLMTKYAINDIKIMLEYVNLKGLNYSIRAKIELGCLLPIVKQERTPFIIDSNYVNKIKLDILKEITNKYQQLHEVAGKEFKIGQHKVILNLIKEKWNLNIKSTSIGALQDELLISKNKVYNQLLTLIIELRSLEKWKTTYLQRFIDNSKNNKWYASYNQLGAKTGRLTSNIQQIPKLPIKIGKSLFTVKKIFKCPENHQIVEIDYANQELRIAAHYSENSPHPDSNLINAFKCYYQDPKTWKPVDLHSLTTLTAFGKVNPELRQIGKSVNFACLYGCGLDGLKRHKDLKKAGEKNIEKCYFGFKETFKNMLKFRWGLAEDIKYFGYITNAFGMKLKWKEHEKLYRAFSILCQGTGAYLLKKKMKLIDNFLTPYKSTVLMNLHDSLTFYIHNDEKHLIRKIQDIMEDNDWCNIKLLTDVKIFTKKWN